VLPVLSLLVIGSILLGAIALQDFALALLVGLLTGSYSSIFIATPILAMLKEREPRYQALSRRLGRATGSLDDVRAVFGATAAEERRPAAAASAPLDGDGVGPASAGATLVTGGPVTAPPRPAALTHPPRPRKKKRR
jgi:preprotein translocase subunit SecF